MQEICLSKIKKSFGFNKKVLNEFDFEVNTGERIALIGGNGSGKTTVFKIIIGEEEIDEGVITIRKNASIGILAQIPKTTNDQILVNDLLKAALKTIYEIENQLHECEQKLGVMTDPKGLDKLLKSYAHLQQKYEMHGGYEVEVKIDKICNGFKISDEMRRRPFNTLSGGEKTIVNLAILMLSSPDILLLDEPTNHLDIDTLEWFEEYLKNYHGTIVISSHDRYFLDQVVTKTILIERGRSEVFHGNYSYYLVENERRIMHEFEDYKNQQKQIIAMKAAIKKLQEYGRLANPGGESFFKRAASIQKRLDKIQLLDQPVAKKALPLDFKISQRSSEETLIVKNLNLTIGTKELFKNTSFTIRYGEKVCLMGKNGSGKSSFIKALLGEIPRIEGSIKIGNKVIIGYIPQEIHFPNENETLISYARKCFIGDETSLRSALFKFMFYEEIILKRVGKLSGGEKVRLKLFELIGKQANLLILDEPTNHIDINTKEILEEALQYFSGTVFFISHDRYFINKLAGITLNIDDQKINYYCGNYDYWKDHH